MVLCMQGNMKWFQSWDIYVDADYAGDVDDRRSTTGYVFTRVGGPICWISTLQSLVALSTTEYEHMTVTEATKEA